MRNTRKLALVGFCVFCAALIARASTGAGAGKELAPVAIKTTPALNEYQDFDSEKRLTLEAEVDMTYVHWKIGGDSYSALAADPQVSLSYGLFDCFDIRLGMGYLSAKDGGDKFDALRLGLGSRAWIETDTDFVPYVGLMAYYYDLNTSGAGNLGGAFGINGEAGIAYLINSYFALRVTAHAETFLINGSGDYYDGKHDVSMYSFGVGLGAILMF